MDVYVYRLVYFFIVLVNDVMFTNSRNKESTTEFKEHLTAWLPWNKGGSCLIEI